jgi:2-succinyl-6-hydroxy-2,4-cyclohexadiene-1-carboxylate synthase
MVVFALHGFAQSPSDWLEFVPEARAPWISGHGAPFETTSNFETEVERLVGIASRLPEPRTLLGYSQGARLGLAMLEAAPDLFRRAVLIGVHPGIETLPAREERQAWEREVAGKLRNEGLQEFWKYWATLPALTPGPRRPPGDPRVEEARHLLHEPAGLGWALETLGLGAMPNLWPQLPALRTPIEFVVGALDRKFLPLARRASELVPTGRLHIVEEAAHNPLRDTPEAMRRLLKGFIET